MSIDAGGQGAAAAGVATWLGQSARAGTWTIDPAGSQVGFAVRHFWGAVTVRGTFSKLWGHGAVGEGGAVSGELHLDAGSVTTKNQRRDDHLRSPDFFSVKEHPEVVVTIAEGRPAGAAALALRGTLEAAGHTEPLEFTAQVGEAGDQTVILRAEVTVDRTHLDMTWNPLGVASKRARLTAVLRFVRS